MTSGPAAPPDPSLVLAVAWGMRWRDRLRSEALVRGLLDVAAPGLTPVQRANALQTLAWHDLYCGRHATAIATGREAIALFAAAGQQSARGYCHFIVAGGLLGTAEFDACRRNLTRGLLMIGDDAACPRGEFHELLAQTLWVTGNPGEALAQAEEALQLSGGEQGAKARIDRAQLLLLGGDGAAARRQADEAEALAAALEAAALLPMIREVQGACMMDAGDVDAALTILEDGQTRATALESPRLRCRLLTEIARCRRAAGERDAAIGAAREALDLVNATDYRLYAPRPALLLADLYEDAGATDDALRAFRAALAYRPPTYV